MEVTLAPFCVAGGRLGVQPLDEVNARTDALVVDRIVRADREVLLKSMLQVKMRSDPISGESESELF